MDWAVYHCDKIARGETPKNEVEISRHATPSIAYDEARRLAKLDRTHSYTVGGT